MTYEEQLKVQITMLDEVGNDMLAALKRYATQDNSSVKGCIFIVRRCLDVKNESLNTLLNDTTSPKNP